MAAAILLVFGLHFLGVIRMPLLYREAEIESTAEPTTVLGAYVMGLAFGFGWTPCVGPALASILMIASGMGDIWRGGLLLLVYGARHDGAVHRGGAVLRPVPALERAAPRRAAPMRKR